MQKKEVRVKLSELKAKVMESDIAPFYGAPTVIAVLADRKVSTHGRVKKRTIIYINIEETEIKRTAFNKTRPSLLYFQV